jgi:hypothetical protein
MTTRGTGSGDSRAILIDLMQTEGEGAGHLSPADLSALLRHQLRTPIALEAEELADARGGREDLQAVVDRAQVTFGDVIRASEASDPLLRLVKTYAKRHLAEDGGLPEPVARFLYVAAVLRARSLGDRTMSGLDDASLEAEARRILTARWLPPEAREILRAGLAR